MKKFKPMVNSLTSSMMRENMIKSEAIINGEVFTNNDGLFFVVFETSSELLGILLFNNGEIHSIADNLPDKESVSLILNKRGAIQCENLKATVAHRVWAT